MTGWTEADIPSQHGRLAVVTGATGATGGIGYETAFALARHGAEVVLASRNDRKGAAALQRIRAAHPGAGVSFESLDLGSLRSVAACAERLLAAGRGIDVLVNNAGIMALPHRQETEDGFERQFGTNYLGHFALTARLLPLLRGRKARVVNVSSLASWQGAIGRDGMPEGGGYAPMRDYAHSKLAMLMFALELQRRSDAGGWGLLGIAAHPGWARTDIIANGPAGDGRVRGLWRVAELLAPVLGQSASAGARPILFAATAPDAAGGGYYGPSGMFLSGPPAPTRLPPQARDAATAASLWDASQRLTGVVFGDGA